MAKRGPKPQVAEVTEAMINEVQILVGRGLTQKQIGNYYGLQPSGWCNLVKKHPELRNAIHVGRSKAISFAAGKLYELVKKGNLSAIIFYLKCQGQGAWTENRPAEDDGEDKPKLPPIVLNINDPLEAARIYQQVMQEK